MEQLPAQRHRHRHRHRHGHGQSPTCTLTRRTSCGLGGRTDDIAQRAAQRHGGMADKAGVDDVEAAAQRAAEQARLRKERREAKIKAGGSARLSKITGMGGRAAVDGASRARRCGAVRRRCG